MNNNTSNAAVATAPSQHSSQQILSSPKTVSSIHEFPSADVRTIDPDWASVLLKHNVSNRPLSETHVKRYMTELCSGKWMLNGETIKLDEQGNLLDGQHRLEAIRRTGIGAQVVLVRGLPSGVFSTIDVGRTRTPADTLAVLGEKHAARLAAALRLVDKYETERMTAKVKYTNGEIADALDKHLDMRVSVDYCLTFPGKKLIPVSVLAACHYLFAMKDRGAADKLIGQVIIGEELPKDSPVYQYRERMLQNTLAKAKISEVYMMALLIKTWNTIRAGGSKKRFLRYRENGPGAEHFPVVQ